jgi:uncharacterized delta-60 repeat protein
MFSFLWPKTNRPAPAPTGARRRHRPRLEALEDRCLPSGGVLDPAFGQGGLVTTTTGGLGKALAVATYPAGTTDAGDVVTVGGATVTKGKNSYTEPAVVRYNLDGTLDTSFGGTGEVLLNVNGEARDVVIQPDGKIVVAYESGSTFNLARYNADGTLDTSFGPNGTGIVNTSTGRRTTDTAYNLALQTNGDIVVAGTYSSGTVTNDLALLRYTAGGLLDTSFGTGGIVTTQFGPVLTGGGSINFIDLALDTSPSDPDAGDIVVVAQLNTQGGPTLVARYTTSGSLDASFGGGAGYEQLSNLNYTPSVAIQANGDILVAARSLNGVMERGRLNPDGSFDASFGSGGIVLVSSPNVFYSAGDVEIESDGKILVAGMWHNTSAGGYYFFVSRFNSGDGSLDTGFGAGGIAVASGSNVGNRVGLALEPDGRLVVAGPELGTSGFALARFVAYGPQIGSFTASPNPVTAGSSLTLTASNISDEIPSATIMQVAFYVDLNGTNTLLGYGTQSSAGVWTFTFTVNLAPGTYTLYAQAGDKPVASTVLPNR